MTQQDIESTISSSFDSLELCQTILSNSMEDLISGSFDTEPYFLLVIMKILYVTC